MGASLAESESERVAVYLTNSLTGWEPPTGPKQHLIFPEMEAERDAAEKVKQHAKILVVIGNPPYNGFAGVDMDEEHAMTDAYRTVKRAPAPQGQGLKDLYVRFFRIAERKIVEGTGSGIVCLISNYSWLDGLSHTGMRERFLDVFDSISIDSLNGDKFRTGKLTPDGKPDPSVFSTEQNTEGIGVGTAISLLLRRPAHSSANKVSYRDFWGKAKREELLQSLAMPERFPYASLEPSASMGFPFMPREIQAGYTEWPSLPDLFPLYSPGVKTSRDAFIQDIDERTLENRLNAYFDPEISDEQMLRLAPDVMASTKRFDAVQTRRYLQSRGRALGKIVRYEYRPFDTVNMY